MFPISIIVNAMDEDGVSKDLILSHLEGYVVFDGNH